jgi:spore photoproduct lyase
MERLSRVKYKEFAQLDGTKKQLVQCVGDGSIIRRFDKTSIPRNHADVVCPHFLESKWAYGCSFDCAWCFLKGTLRLLDIKTKPVVKDYCKTQKHAESLFKNDGDSCELLNSGELADSPMTESTKTPFSKFIIPLFEKQERHMVLLLTKSADIKNFEKIESYKQTIISFSLNAPIVSKRWEMGLQSKEEFKQQKL